MLNRLDSFENPIAAWTASPPVDRALRLDVQGVALDAGGKRLLSNIDLTLRTPGLTMVMGPNGAGKSLLLRLLHGLLQPTSGTIRWGGEPMSETIRRSQAMVFQRPVLLRRSVAENIDFVSRLRNGAARDRRDAILDHVGLLNHARQPARLLSVGEQQRLALARALILEPKVLFLDEPTASLDPASIMMIEDIVSDARRQGLKIIFVTHDIGQATRLADEVVFLHRGCLSEHSPASRFFVNPSSEAARGYLEGRIVL